MATKTETNLKLWDAMKDVDRTFTKKITGKSYGGDSPNPTYVIRKLTEQLGPIGDKWGFNVLEERILEGAPHSVVIEQHQEFGPPPSEGPAPILSKTARYEIVREQYHQVRIHFWFLHEDGDTRGFDCFGGTPMLYVSRKGLWIMDEDAAKKSLTDAFTKGASWLGACAEIFLGIFDDKHSSAEPSGSNTTSDQPANSEKKPSASQEGERETDAPW